MNLSEEKNLAGCRGIYCGLCPRFQSSAKSRCLGCKSPERQQAYCCVVFACCVKKRGFDTCAECDEYPCEKVRKVLYIQANGTIFDSFMTHKPRYFDPKTYPNIRRIRKIGLDIWLKEQKERRLVLEEILDEYNEGRSMTLYCTAAALMSINSLLWWLGAGVVYEVGFWIVFKFSIVTMFAGLTAGLCLLINGIIVERLSK